MTEFVLNKRAHILQKSSSYFKIVCARIATRIQRCHIRKFINYGDLAPGIFATLIWRHTSLLSKGYRRYGGRSIDLSIVQRYEGWNFNSGNYLFTTDTK